MQALKFKNFTNEDFSWAYNGEVYNFLAGQEIFLEDYKAYHFAKHLVDREMNRLRIPTNDEGKRAELGAQCFPSDEAVTPLEALNIEEVKKVVKRKSKKKEVEFEELEK